MSARVPLTFRIFRGDQLIRVDTLTQSVIKIGKVSSAHLQIDDESVSRMHAILEVDQAGAVHLIDLGSTRGTFVNGAKVNKAKLESGDAIQLGAMRIEVTISLPSSAVQNSAVQNAAVQNSAVPNSAVPKTAVPNSAVPNSGVPNSAVPNSAVPNSAVPNSAVPNSAVPNSAVTPMFTAPPDDDIGAKSIEV